MNQESGELHLFIIWEHARIKEREILESLNGHFNILGVYEVKWSDSKFSENLSRFYGSKLPRGSFKERHCGKGPFLLVVLEDRNPVYMERATSRGIEIVNVNTFDLKSLYRKWTGGGHRIHGTNSLKETNHDLTLLLGICADDYQRRSKKWNGLVTEYNNDLIGANGWNSIKQLFYVLNHTTDYLVLRNFEPLPDQYHVNNHGDIDLLTKNYNDLIWILNGKKVYKGKHRVHHKVVINHTPVMFDIRYIGDNYYDQSWQEEMLRKKVKVRNSFYAVDSENYFYSLLYHALIHKKQIANDYISRLLIMADSLGINDGSKIIDFRNKENLLELLTQFMDSKGYLFTEPKDLSVYFNYELANKQISSKRRVYEKLFLPLRRAIKAVVNNKETAR